MVQRIGAVSLIQGELARARNSMFARVVCRAPFHVLARGWDSRVPLEMLRYWMNSELLHRKLRIIVAVLQ